MLYTGLFISFQPYLIKLIIDQTMSYQGDQLLQHVLPYISYFIIAQILFSLAWDFKHIVERSVVPYIEANVSMHVFSYLQKQSYRYFQDRMPGALSNKIADLQSGIERLQNITVHFFRLFIGISMTFFFMAKVHWMFALVMICWTILFMSMSCYMALRLEPFTMERARMRTQLFGRIVDSLTNVMTIRLFARQDYEIQRQKDSFNDYIQNDRKLRYHQIIVWGLLGGFAVLLLAIMLCLLVYGVERNWVVMSDFAFVMMTSISIIENMFFLMDFITEFSSRWGTAKQGAEILSDPLEIEEHRGIKTLSVKRGAIEFKDVTFSYNKKPFLNNISLKIFGGQKVGLVGYSGGGKTTLINLLCRLFDPQQGVVSIDGIDIKTVSQDSLHEAVSYVPQDPVLFHRSIAENIGYGKLNATEAEIIEAARMANCHEFITKLPEGYQTIVGERGLKLSGGQRQRIAIARAYLKNAPILVMDEATSALDSATEALIQESMQILMDGKTVIVVAHRLSTLLSMDRIIVFSKGYLAEDGNHQELLKQKGLYYTLWNAQKNGFIRYKKKEGNSDLKVK